MTDTYKIAMNTLSTRDKAEQIFQEAKEQDCSALDFSSVEFVSRSFADEMNYLTSQSEVDVCNLQENVAKMFKLVDEKKMVAD